MEEPSLEVLLKLLMEAEPNVLRPKEAVKYKAILLDVLEGLSEHVDYLPRDDLYYMARERFHDSVKRAGLNVDKARFFIRALEVGMLDEKDEG